MKGIEQVKLIRDFIRYNVKIIFANKFIYFLIAAFAFFLMVTGIMLFSDSSPEEADIFSTLLFPGILILFYPVIYNIQSDKDTRMLEIIFGIPNYRYKVYLVRFLLSIMLLLVLISFMSWIVVFAIIRIPVFHMVYELMYSLIFLASLAFLLASLIKNASGASVIMVIIGLIFLILAEPLESSKWNIFLNPFNVPSDMSYAIWQNVLYQNRMMLIVGSIISILWSLINLQKREKFV
ncbi:hypothetical protein DWB61_12910 [Ancylomarina euxinus]|uniref:Uncharacterized protein n=1 Tax=Ancylomarina euxinus TaxID=2283627 RepID=A0A425XYN7_9BACT|nr:hypothetical protein [Ancylomarina euxinus]MCZ4695700.1 hypothetical protein [Ancylomarina euxinus]MUP15997.1 hypothetical protein [Ancylomarina euxinus]RRG20244.1 hypothetical protein DWB61_12910 [Ancylomarina euxinus]